MDMNIRLCGEAGQGLQTVGKVLAAALARQGWEVFAHQDYESRIRGGSNYFQIGISRRQLTCHQEKVDLLIAMSVGSWHQFSRDLKPEGTGIHPPGVEGAAGLALDVAAIAARAGSKKLASAVVGGIVWGVMGGPFTGLEQQLRLYFARRGEELINSNVEAARAGYYWAESQDLGRKLPAPERGRDRMLMRGNDAVALGAMAAGIKFISAYPMTPSTSIVEYIAARAQRAGIRVEQAEDEIAAINMALGAGYAGVRDREQALALAGQWGEQIPLGVIYRSGRPDPTPDQSLVDANLEPKVVEGILEQYRV